MCFLLQSDFRDSSLQLLLDVYVWKMGIISKVLFKSSATYSHLNDPNSNSANRTFKERKSLAERKADVETIRNKFPTKIPIIVERYKKEKSLPPIDKVKFLVPIELTMAQFTTIVRNRLSLGDMETFYMYTDTGHMPALSINLTDLYNQCQDMDGFLYVTYASQEVFG